MKINQRWAFAVAAEEANKRNRRKAKKNNQVKVSVKKTNLNSKGKAKY